MDSPPTLINEYLNELRRNDRITSAFLEGFHDDEKLNITEGALTIAHEGVSDNDRRVNLIKAAIKANEDLLSDHYPTLPRFMAQKRDYESLVEQIATMTAALGQVDVEAEVASGDVTFTDVPSAAPISFVKEPD